MRKEKVSVIVPVYRGSSRLGGLLERLCEDGYSRKEIIVVVSDPDTMSVRLIKKFNGRVNFVVSDERLGKSEAVDRGIEAADGDIFVFFDADNRISGQPGLLSSVVSQMRGFDIADFPIFASKGGFWSKMADFDFLNSSFTSMLLSKSASSKPLISSAAFVVRREAYFDVGGVRRVLSEDFDFGWRAFERGKRYRQISGFKVFTDSPGNFSGWAAQRKRWCVGAADWLSSNYGSIPASLARNRKGLASIPLIFLLFPTLMVGGISLLVSESAFERGVSIFFIVAPLKFTELLPFSFILLSSMVLMKNVFMLVAGFASSSLITYFASRYFGHGFSLGSFALYYFVYSPLLSVMFLYGLVKVFILRDVSIKGWKV